MVVGRGVRVIGAVTVGMDVRVSVAVGIDVGVMGALLPQADEKYAKGTINRSVNFIRT